MSSLTPRADRAQKNYIINGDMRISQRGTSFAAIAGNAYSLDRWQYFKSGAMVHTVSQGTDVPTLAQAGYLFQNSLVATLTTPDTSIGATDYCALSHAIEGYNWASLAQKPLTFSFWVKATLAGTYCVSLSNTNQDRTYVAEYTINATNTWEKKTITIAASPSGGTWDYTNGVGIRMRFTIAVGSDFVTGSPNTWLTGNFRGTANQVNGVNTGATSFLITGVCLHEGELEDPAFSTFGKDFEGELAACQRYYEAMPYRFRYTISSGTGEMQIYYRVSKRALPTLTTTADTVSPETTGSAAGTESVRLTFATNASSGNITADAEL